MSDGAVTLRLATAADDTDIGELLVRAFVDTYAKKMPEVVVEPQRRQDLRQVAAKRAVATVWVAERAGSVVGTVALWPPGAPGSEAWLPGAADLRHLGTDESERGSGLSARLLDLAEAEARRLRATAVCLHVRRGAVGVAELYRRRGYARAPEGDVPTASVFLEAMVLPLR